MSFDESIQQLRDKQLADQKDAERFISVKELFEQLKQRYADLSYGTLCLMVLKKYRSAQDKPSFYWFSDGRWDDIMPYPRFVALDQKITSALRDCDYYPDADTALRAVNDDAMKADKLSGYGFLRSEITTALGITFDTTPSHMSSDSYAYAELQAENIALKEQIERLEKRLSAPIAKAETYASKRGEFYFAVIASLYDKKRAPSSRASLPIATELLRLVESRIPLFWSAEKCFPMSEEQCLKKLREAIGWLDRDVTDLYLVREKERQSQKNRKINNINQPNRKGHQGIR